MATLSDRTAEISGNIMDAEISPRTITNNVVVVNKDLSMGIGWKLHFPSLINLGEAARDEILMRIRAALSTLPEHFDIQFFHNQHHRPDAVLERFKTDPHKNPIVNGCRKQKLDYMERALKGNHLRMIEGYVILVRQNTVPMNKMRKRTLERYKREKGFKDGKVKGIGNKIAFLAHWNKVQFFDSSIEHELVDEEFQDGLRELLSYSDGFHDSLSGVPQCTELEVLEENDIISLFYRYWNPASFDRGQNPPKYRPDKNLPLTEYFIASPFQWDSTGTNMPRGTFYMDGVYHRMLSLRLPPETMYFTSFDRLIYESGISRMNILVNIEHGDTQKRIQKLNRRLPQIEYAARKDPSMQSSYEEIYQELVDLGRDADKVWLATHFVHIWGETRDEIESATQAVKKSGESAGGMVLTEETHALWEYWRAAQPFWTRDYDRYRQNYYNTRQLVTQLPICGAPTLLEHDAGSFFETRTRTVYNLNFQDQQLFSNYNAIVIGGSGAGKSFWVNSFICDIWPLKPHPKVFLIDYGGSFKGLAEMLNGSYLDFDIKSSDKRINPLYLEGQAVPDPDTVSSMMFFLEKLLVDPVSEQRFPKDLAPVIEETLVNLLRRAEGKEVFLSDLRDALQKNPLTKTLARRLFSWCERGVYGALFDGPTQISFENPLTVFDLKNIKSNADLKPVMFATITQQVLQAGYRNPGVPKYLVFDEAWDMLADPIIGNYVETAFRAFRKLGFTVIAVTQGVEELMNMTNKAAILNNISNWVILKQNDATAIEPIVEELLLSEQEAAMIADLESVPGRHSECLLVQETHSGKRSTLIINRSIPLLYAAFTTNDRDKAKIGEYLEQGMTYPQAVTRFSEEFPNGVGQVER